MHAVYICISTIYRQACYRMDIKKYACHTKFPTTQEYTLYTLTQTHVDIYRVVV